MTNSHKWSLVALGVLAVAGAGTKASAGYRTRGTEVYLVRWSDGGGYAAGSLGAVRASADSSQYLRCWVTGSGGPNPYTPVYNTSSSGGCSATDATGASAYCTFGNTGNNQPNGFSDALGSLTQASDLSFSWDANHNCTWIGVQSTTYNLPLSP